MLDHTPPAPVASNGNYTAIFHQSEKEANSPQPADPNATSAADDLWAPLALLLDHDDQFFSEQLPDLVKANQFSPYDDQLWHPRVLARLCGLSDPLFTATVIDLAHPDCLGLDILFDERLLPRMATMRNGHLRGTFLPYARRIPGFDARDFLRELRRTQHTLQTHQARTGTPAVVSMETVTRKPVTWLWWPYIALGKLTMLDGDPGIGKSLLMTQLAASLSQGHPLPDQEGTPTLGTGGAHTTVMLSTEDGLEDTLKPRLDDAGADCSKIKVLTGWVDANGEEHVFTFEHLPVLERTLETYQPRLVIIDPIQSYLGSRVDMHRANETRPLLAALVRMAEQYQCAIVCVRHPAKSSQGGKAIHRGLGSVDFIGAARTGLFVEQHPTDPGKVLLAQSKNNIGPLGHTQMFTKYEGHFEWCGVSRLSAELLAGSGRGPDPYIFLEAVCWLEERLADGVPVSTELLQQEAVEEGLTLPALRRAKKALGVRSIRNGEQWDWQLRSLPTLPLPTPFLSLATLLPLEPLEHVQAHQDVTLHASWTDTAAAPVGCAQPLSTAPEEQGTQAPPTVAAQPVETVEDVQEAEDAQAAEEMPAPAHTPGAPPCYCPGCSRKTTWVKRGDFLFCYKCHTRAPRPR